MKYKSLIYRQMLPLSKAAEKIGHHSNCCVSRLLDLKSCLDHKSLGLSFYTRFLCEFQSLHLCVHKFQKLVKRRIIPFALCVPFWLIQVKWYLFLKSVLATFTQSRFFGQGTSCRALTLAEFYHGFNWAIIKVLGLRFWPIYIYMYLGFSFWSYL